MNDRKMKDHEIRELVDSVTKAVKKVCPNSPQCLRETISHVVKERFKKVDSIDVENPNGTKTRLVLLAD